MRESRYSIDGKRLYRTKWSDRYTMHFSICMSCCVKTSQDGVASILSPVYAEALRTQRENTLEKPTYIGKKSRLQIQLGKFHPTSGPSHVAMFESWMRYMHGSTLWPWFVRAITKNTSYRCVLMTSHVTMLESCMHHMHGSTPAVIVVCACKSRRIPRIDVHSRAKKLIPSHAPSPPITSTCMDVSVVNMHSLDLQGELWVNTT
jgi:hypothetical protein